MGSRGVLSTLIVLLSVLNGCGGSSPSAPATPPPTTPPTTTLPPATLADLSATTASPQDGGRINCRNNTHATVTLTNRAGRDVAVSGIRRVGRSGTEDCIAAPEFTHRTAARSAPGGGAATVVLDTDLYGGDGSGCCPVKGQCGGACTFFEHFYVVTAVGEVDAGEIDVRIQFDGNCKECASGARVSSGGGEVCGRKAE